MARALRSSSLRGMDELVDDVLAALHPELRARCTAATIVSVFKESGAQGRRSNVGSLLDHVWLTAPSGAVGLI